MTTTPESSLASPEGVAFVRRLGVNTIAQTVGLAGGTVLGFLNFLAVTRGLGPEAFGDLTAATVFLLFPVALADVGLATGVLREVSVAPERTEFVMRATWPLRTLISAAVLGAALAVSLALPFTDRAQTAIWLSSIGSLFALLTLSLQPLFQARLQMHVPVGATLAGRALTLGLILAAFATDRGFTEVVLAYVVGMALTFAIVLAAAARRISLGPLIQPDYWRTLVRGSLAIGIATGLFLSYYRIDTVLVALLRDSHEAGLYGAAFKFVEIAEVLVAAIGVSVFPSFARLVATGDPRIAGALQRSLDVVVTVSAPILVGLLLVSDELVTLTAGEEFAEAASALRLLVPYLALLFLNAILIRLAAALHVDKHVLVLAVVVLVLNVALNVALLPTYGYKVAAITSTASEVCVAAVLAMIVWRRLAFVPSLRYVWAVGLAVAAMLASYWLLPLPALVAVAVASLVYSVVVVALPGTARDVVVALARRGGA
ncbi:MAG: oligosaccharide flippase family protein [Actinomycetota bacterium]|nr:oligosaccharide flippase family protein [Actinomycetota bacterium]